MGDERSVTERLAGFAVRRHYLPPDVEELLRATMAGLPDSGGPVPAGQAGVARICAGALVGLAVEQGLSAAGTRVAAAVGAEVAVRLHAALGPRLRARGWDECAGPVVCGVAAGAARILGLPAGAVQRCLSIAGTQVAGLGSAQPAWSPFQVRRAVGSGLEAARLGAAGMSAPADGLGGRRGLIAVMAPGVDTEALTARLGVHWVIACALDPATARMRSGVT